MNNTSAIFLEAVHTLHAADAPVHARRAANAWLVAFSDDSSAPLHCNALLSSAALGVPETALVIAAGVVASAAAAAGPEAVLPLLDLCFSLPSRAAIARLASAAAGIAATTHSEEALLCAPAFRQLGQPRCSHTFHHMLHRTFNCHKPHTFARWSEWESACHCSQVAVLHALGQQLEELASPEELAFRNSRPTNRPTDQLTDRPVKASLYPFRPTFGRACRIAMGILEKALLPSPASAASNVVGVLPAAAEPDAALRCLACWASCGVSYVQLTSEHPTLLAALLGSLQADLIGADNSTGRLESALSAEVMHSCLQCSMDLDEELELQVEFACMHWMGSCR